MSTHFSFTSRRRWCTLTLRAIFVSRRIGDKLHCVVLLVQDVLLLAERRRKATQLHHCYRESSRKVFTNQTPKIAQISIDNHAQSLQRYGHVPKSPQPNSFTFSLRESRPEPNSQSRASSSARLILGPKSYAPLRSPTSPFTRLRPISHSTTHNGPPHTARPLRQEAFPLLQHCRRARPVRLASSTIPSPSKTQDQSDLDTPIAHNSFCPTIANCAYTHSPNIQAGPKANIPLPKQHSTQLPPPRSPRHLQSHTPTAPSRGHQRPPLERHQAGCLARTLLGRCRRAAERYGVAAAEHGGHSGTEVSRCAGAGEGCEGGCVSGEEFGAGGEGGGGC